MKKLFLLVVLFTAMYAANAQGGANGGDPAAMMARMKERIKPGLIEKTKISDAEADKVIEICLDIQRQMRELRQDQALSDDDRKKKVEAINADRDKKFKAIPLTDEQVKAINEYFTEMQKAQQQQRGHYPAG